MHFEVDQIWKRNICDEHCNEYNVTCNKVKLGPTEKWDKFYFVEIKSISVFNTSLKVKVLKRLLKQAPTITRYFYFVTVQHWKRLLLLLSYCNEDVHWQSVASDHHPGCPKLSSSRVLIVVQSVPRKARWTVDTGEAVPPAYIEPPSGRIIQRTTSSRPQILVDVICAECHSILNSLRVYWCISDRVSTIPNESRQANCIVAGIGFDAKCSIFSKEPFTGL